MKIREVLAQLQGFTAYIESLQGDTATHGSQALTHWNYVLGVYGPTPMLWVHGSLGHIHTPLQAVALGWDGCDELRAIRPFPADVQRLLDLSPQDYTRLDNATHLIEPWHPQLRQDMIEACGLGDETESNFFKGKYDSRVSKRKSN